MGRGVAYRGAFALLHTPPRCIQLEAGPASNATGLPLRRGNRDRQKEPFVAVAAPPCFCAGPSNARDEADAFEVLSRSPFWLHPPARRPTLTRLDCAVWRSPAPVKPEAALGRGIPLQTDMVSHNGYTGTCAAADSSLQKLPRAERLPCHLAHSSAAVRGRPTLASRRASPQPPGSSMTREHKPAWSASRTRARRRSSRKARLCTRCQLSEVDEKEGDRPFVVFSQVRVSAGGAAGEGVLGSAGGGADPSSSLKDRPSEVRALSPDVGRAQPLAVPVPSFFPIPMGDPSIVSVLGASGTFSFGLSEEAAEAAARASDGPGGGARALPARRGGRGSPHLAILEFCRGASRDSPRGIFRDFTSAERIGAATAAAERARRAELLARAPS